MRQVDINTTNQLITPTVAFWLAHCDLGCFNFLLAATRLTWFPIAVTSTPLPLIGVTVNRPAMYVTDAKAMLPSSAVALTMVCVLSITYCVLRIGLRRKDRLERAQRYEYFDFARFDHVGANRKTNHLSNQNQLVGFPR